MDQPGTDKALILKELKKKLDASCVDMEDPEDIATGDERALEEYLEAGEVSIDTISQMIADRQIFPCYFGAALKLQGVQELLDGIGKYVGDNVSANYDQADNRLQNSGDAQQFGARVYKISRDPQGNRLTHMKITSGELKVKSLLKGGQVVGREDRPDPNLFRRKIRDSTTGESRHDVCCDRIKAYISRGGTWN